QPAEFPGRDQCARVRRKQGSAGKPRQGPGQRVGLKRHQCQRHCARVYQHRQYRSVAERPGAQQGDTRPDSGRALGPAGRFPRSRRLSGVTGGRLCAWNDPHSGRGMDGEIKTYVMEIKFEHSPKEVRSMTTEELRAAFLTGPLMEEETIRLVYSHYDRVIVGGAKPVRRRLPLEAHSELKADYFLQRRELGIINVGGRGKVYAGEAEYDLDKLDCLYVGRGVKNVGLGSVHPEHPAQFYLLSAPAHTDYPVRLMQGRDATPATTGSAGTANARTIYKYIHADGIRSCQIVMGLT